MHTSNGIFKIPFSILKGEGEKTITGHCHTTINISHKFPFILSEIVVIIYQIVLFFILKLQIYLVTLSLFDNVVLFLLFEILKNRNNGQIN